MRPPRLRPIAPDPLSRTMAAHARAEDRRREAERTVTLLRGRLASARAAAAERRRLAGEALRRGEEPWGLSLLDAALHADAEAADLAGRVSAAERHHRDLAAAERFLRAELFRVMGQFLVEVGAT